jgi:hypothetical protein
MNIRLERCNTAMLSNLRCSASRYSFQIHKVFRESQCLRPVSLCNQFVTCNAQHVSSSQPAVSDELAFFAGEGVDFRKLGVGDVVSQALAAANFSRPSSVQVIHQPIQDCSNQTIPQHRQSCNVLSCNSSNAATQQGYTTITPSNLHRTTQTHTTSMACVLPHLVLYILIPVLMYLLVIRPPMSQQAAALMP